jgi:hypothetical protein
MITRLPHGPRPVGFACSYDEWRDWQWRLQLGSFDGKFLPTFSGDFRKKTCGRSSNSHRLPSLRLSVAKETAMGERRRRRVRFFPQIFSDGYPKLFGKGIDGATAEVLAETLSLDGKLFEIYFVRLIGTPNQNSKSGISFG